jgi:hypothetical protein
MAYEDGYIY